MGVANPCDRTLCIRPFDGQVSGATLAMLRRLTALAFILALVAGTAAGTPLHASNHECGMAGMDGMECCEKARAHENSAEALAARLCCAFSCTQPAPVNTSGLGPVQAPSAGAPHPAETPSQAHALHAARNFSLSLTLQSESPPGYISHSALLI